MTSQATQSADVGFSPVQKLIRASPRLPGWQPQIESPFFILYNRCVSYNRMPPRCCSGLLSLLLANQPPIDVVSLESNRDEIYSMACTIQHPGIRSMYLQPRFAAIDALTRNLALEWGSDYDIRVNGIAQGPIGDTAGMSKLAPEEIINNMREHMPLYKLGEKWDIALAAVYMASDAGKYINGSVLPVDGGLWLSRPRHLAKDAVRQVSRAVEKRTRAASIGVPKSKL
ncbi:hypothetical protein ACS0TY_009327 [Phlomoides rotata]